AALIRILREPHVPVKMISNRLLYRLVWRGSTQGDDGVWGRVRDRIGGLFTIGLIREGEAPAEPQRSQWPVHTARREARPPEGFA
ncbi:MAG: hypothetical protein AAB385_06765, partial [Planctomycetota bacterium]